MERRRLTDSPSGCFDLLGARTEYEAMRPVIDKSERTFD